jgi:hypothetical protein
LIVSKKRALKAVVDLFAPKVDVPAVNRLDMSYKDVTARVPELTEAARRVQAGRMTQSEYAALVNALKPVKPYEFIPKPATVDEAIAALTSNKRGAYGKTADIGAGEVTDLRLDIPAYSQHGVWVNSIHRKGAPTVYGSTSSVTDATMIPSPEKAMKVATGETSKAPFAVIRGGWNPMDEAFAVEQAQKYLKHKDWRQVGYDPERHGYFYDRETMSPIVSADEVIQIGPLVLAKKPQYGDPEDFPFRKGGAVNKNVDETIAQAKLAQAKQGPIRGYAPARTRTISQFEKDFDQYLAAQQEARQRLLTERIPKSIDDAIAKAAGLGKGAMGALAGYAAQLPGIPGDLLSLYEEFKPSSAPELPEVLRALPTTERLQEYYLPENTSDDLKAGITGGNAVAIAQAIASLPQVAKAIGRGAKALAPTAGEMAENYLTRAGLALRATSDEGRRVDKRLKPFAASKISEPSHGLNIIKDPGGNWIAGGTYPLDDLRSGTVIQIPGEHTEDFVARSSINNWVDKNLTKYVKNEMATEKDPVRLQAESFPKVKAELLAAKQKQIDKATADLRKAQSERGVNPEMLTRSQARIRDLEKEKELIEGRTGLHFKPEDVSADASLARGATSSIGDKKYYTRGRGAQGRAWEDVADAAVFGDTYGNRLRGTSKATPDRLPGALRDLGGEYAVANPNAMAYSLATKQAAEKLGFNHLIDELRNATRADTDLPKAFQIDPKDLPKWSVPQAVARVDEINAWRKVQSEDALNVAREGIPVHKEYPEGYQWLALPDLQTSPEALKYATEVGCQGGWCTEGANTAMRYGSGNNRLYVLHNPEGKAVAQISTKQQARNDPARGLRDIAGVPPELLGEYQKAFAASGKHTMHFSDNFWPWLQQSNPEEFAKLTAELPPKIAEIKGLQNKKPNPEDLPFIQDFVKSQQWSDVGDLQNTGLKNIASSYGDEPLAKAMREKLGGYATQDEIDQFLYPWKQPEGGMKRGGPVNQDAMQMAVMNKQLRKRHG